MIVRSRLSLLTALCCLLYASCASAPTIARDDSVRVTMVTTGGTFTLKLLPSIAPRTVAQLRRLIAAHVFDSVYFYRVERGFVAQTATADDREVPLSKEQRSLISPIPLEVSTLLHTRGVLSLAYGDDPNSGETSFSILLNDAPHLDGHFTVFGVLENSEPALRYIEQHYDQRARDADGRRLQILRMALFTRSR